MKKIFRIVQFGSNLGIIVMSLLLTFVVLSQYVISPGNRSDNNLAQSLFQSKARPPTAITEKLNGKVVPLSNIDWDENRVTLVLYLSTKCHFCSESIPFYKRLANEKINSGFKLVAVLPQNGDEANKYLESNGIHVDQMVSASLGSIGVTSTPTIILVSEGGVVSDSWRGKLDENREAEVLSKLSTNSLVSRLR